MSYTNDQFDAICELATLVLPAIASSETDPAKVAKKSFATAMAFAAELTRLDQEMFPDEYEMPEGDSVYHVIADEL